MNRQLINPWQLHITELLNKFSYDSNAKEILSAASALKGVQARNAIQMKDYVLTFNLQANERESQYIVSDQGHDFFITSLSTDFNQFEIDVNIPYIRFRDDNLERNFAGGYPRNENPGFQPCKNFGPANDHISQGAITYKILSEPKEWNYYLGDRKILECEILNNRIPAVVTVLMTGFLFNKSQLGIS
jgi:hypothetical protein